MSSAWRAHVSRSHPAALVLGVCVLLLVVVVVVDEKARRCVSDQGAAVPPRVGPQHVHRGADAQRCSEMVGHVNFAEVANSARRQLWGAKHLKIDRRLGMQSRQACAAARDGFISRMETRE